MHVYFDAAALSVYSQGKSSAKEQGFDLFVNSPDSLITPAQQPSSLHSASLTLLTSLSLAPRRLSKVDHWEWSVWTCTSPFAYRLTCRIRFNRQHRRLINVPSCGRLSRDTRSNPFYAIGLVSVVNKETPFWNLPRRLGQATAETAILAFPVWGISAALIVRPVAYGERGLSAGNPPHTRLLATLVSKFTAWGKPATISGVHPRL